VFLIDEVKTDFFFIVNELLLARGALYFIDFIGLPSEWMEDSLLRVFFLVFFLIYVAMMTSLNCSYCSSITSNSNKLSFSVLNSVIILMINSLSKIYHLTFSRAFNSAIELKTLPFSSY